MPGANGGQVLPQTPEGIQPALQPEGKTQVFQTALQDRPLAAAKEKSVAGLPSLFRVCAPGKGHFGHSGGSHRPPQRKSGAILERGESAASLQALP